MNVTRCIRCFEALISNRDSGEVLIERFGEVVAWLGDLPENGRKIMVTAKKLLAERYFFGDISTSEAENLLAGNNPGTFLVRFGTTKLGGYTISRVRSTGAIEHNRIGHVPGSLDFTYGDKRAKSLPDLINIIRPNLHLMTPCPGWQFGYLFNSIPSSSGYAGGYADGDDNDNDYYDDDENME